MMANGNRVFDHFISKGILCKSQGHKKARAWQKPTPKALLSGNSAITHKESLRVASAPFGKNPPTPCKNDTTQTPVATSVYLL